MNFFGHATVAAWAPGATPPFVLGAMLPDFAAISGARSARPRHAEARRGVALHLATDEVFHAAPDFVALTALVRERLERGRHARDLLTGIGYRIAWHEYRMPHSVCTEEVADIAAWLAQIL